MKSTITSPEPTAVSPVATQGSAMLDVKGVASVLRCSIRHVYRLADAGKMPRPIKLGQLCRWRLGELRAWIDDGCKPVSTNAAQQRGGA